MEGQILGLGEDCRLRKQQIQQTSDFQLKNIPSLSQKSTCSKCNSKRSTLLLPIVSQRLSPRNEVADQPSVEVADKDDGGGVVRLGHDGRLPLQVLGDCRGRRSCTASPPSVPRACSGWLVRQVHIVKGSLPKGGWGELVVAD